MLKRTISAISRPFSVIQRTTFKQSINKKNWEFYQGQIKANIENINKTYVKSISEMALAEQTKVVLPVLRERKDRDRLMVLKSRGEVPGIIRRKNGEVVDLVMETSQARAVSKLQDANIRQITIVCEGLEYNVLFEDLIRYTSEGWMAKIVFNEFVPGEANLVTLPLRLMYKKSFWKKKGKKAEKWQYKFIEVISFNLKSIGCNLYRKHPSCS